MSALVDNNQDSYRSFAKMMRALFILGGADPADFPLSDATVSRHLKSGRESSATKAFQQDFPPNGILHFDGVKKKLGRRQGGGKFAIEHMCLTYTHGDSERKIGIFQLPDGKGLLLEWQRIRIEGNRTYSSTLLALLFHPFLLLALLFFSYSSQSSLILLSGKRRSQSSTFWHI